MGAIHDTATSVYRDYVTDGVPSSGAHEPVKSEIRALFFDVEQQIDIIANGVVIGGAVGYATKAAMDADTSQADGTFGVVYANDGSPAENGIYVWNASGPSWDDAGLTIAADVTADLAQAESDIDDLETFTDRLDNATRPDRPGEAPDLYTTTPETTPASATAASAASVGSNPILGADFTMGGGETLGRFRLDRIEPNTNYVVEATGRRTVDATDAADNPVDIKLAMFNSTKTFLSTLTVGALNVNASLTGNAARVAGRFPFSASITGWDANARYVRAYAETRGADGTFKLEVLRTRRATRDEFRVPADARPGRFRMDTVVRYVEGLPIEHLGGEMNPSEPANAAGTAAIDPFYVSYPIKTRTIRWTYNGGTLDFQWLPDGMGIDLFYDRTSGNDLKLYAGSSNWIGYTQATLNLPAQSWITVRRFATKLLLDAHGATITEDATAAAARSMSLIVGGQSNAALWIQKSGIGGLQIGLAELNLLPTIWAINGAEGGTAVMEVNEPTRYWWSTAGTPGPWALNWQTAMQAAVAAGQPAPTLIYWDQGEADALGLTNETNATQAQYQAAVEALFAWMRARIVDEGGAANCPIIFCLHGSRDDAAARNKGITAVRQTYLNIAASDANTHHGPEKYDLPRTNFDIHLDLVGYHRLGKRLAAHYDNVLNAASNDVGPELSSVTFDANLPHQVKLVFTSGMSNAGAVRPGAAELPDEVPIGFAIIPSGGSPALSDPLPISRFEWPATVGLAGSNELIIHSTSDLTGCRIVYPYGIIDDIRSSSIIRDRGGPSGLPLRAFITAALA